MGRTFRCAAIVAILLASQATAKGQGRPELRLDAETPDPVVTHHPLLRDSLDRISRGSARFREALDSLRQSGRWALVLTPDQIVVTDAFRSRLAAFDQGVLAEVSPVTRGRSQVDAVLVVINLPLLERAHEQRNSLPVELHGDIDRIVIHEVFGHALPYLLAGDLSGQCADPAPGQRAEEACAIQRENAVRAELGLGRRTDAGLFGLSLAWRGRH